MVYTTPPTNFSPQLEVVSCFCERHDKILLLLRQDHKPQGNVWAVPAGKVELEESLHEAMVRELSEELGVNYGIDDLQYLNKVYVTYPEFDFVYHIFRLTEFEQVITLNPKEHKEYRWAKPQEALQLPLIPGERDCIKMHY